MPAHTGAAGHAYDEGHAQGIRQVIEVAEPQHQIGLLIADGVPGDEIIVPEILFGLLEFDNSDGCPGGGAQELLSGVRASGCQACGRMCRARSRQRMERAKADYRNGALRRSCPVYIHCRMRSLRRRAALDGLVPDGFDPGGTVQAAEECGLIIDPAVQEADEHAVSIKLQGGIVLDGKDARLIERRHIGGGVTSGDRIIGVAGQGDRIRRIGRKIVAGIVKASVLPQSGPAGDLIEKSGAHMISDEIRTSSDRMASRHVLVSDGIG